MPLEEGFDLRGSEVSFETDASAVDELLPRWYRATERPTVSVAYRHMIGMRWMGGRDHEFRCQEYDALLIRAGLRDLAPVAPDELAAARDRARSAHSYYWKYVPGPQGTVDADYPVGIRMQIPYTAMWSGAAELELRTPDATDAPYSSKILAALAGLPRRSEARGLSWEAAACTLFRGETRRLDLPGAEAWLTSGP